MRAAGRPSPRPGPRCGNVHCGRRPGQDLTGSVSAAVTSLQAPKSSRRQRGVLGGGGAPLVRPAPSHPHAHSYRAPGLYPFDEFHLHLRLHLNKGSVAKNSLKITGLIHHVDSADELTQNN